MTGPSAPIALTAHLALVSSISFGGFPTVLPDVRNFVVGTHGWMTDQDFANIFAMAQSIPGPNMILMMSFCRLEGVGISRCGRERVCHLRASMHDLLCLLPAMGPVRRRAMAADRAPRPDSGHHGARDRQRHRDGARRGHQLAGRCPYDRRSRDHADDPAQSHVDAAGGWCAWRPRPPVKSRTAGADDQREAVKQQGPLRVSFQGVDHILDPEGIAWRARASAQPRAV